LNLQAELRRRARGRPRRVVFAEGADPRVLEATARILDGAWLEPVLVGDAPAITSGLRALGVAPEQVEIWDPRGAWNEELPVARLLDRRAGRGLTEAEARQCVRQPLFLAAHLVASREVDGSVAGLDHTTRDVFRAALWCVGPADGIRTVSSAFYMVVPEFRGAGIEVLTFADCALVRNPGAQELAEIAVAAARARRRVVGDEPIVAFLSYSTQGSAEGASVDRIRAAAARFRALAPEVQSDGELQVDTALVRAVAEQKAPGSAVGGRANVLIFPDLDSGNIGYKLVQRLAGAEAVGPIFQGLRFPCNDLSRGASVDEVVDVACITALTAP
jgi:phosphate acetyltransferase